MKKSDLVIQLSKQTGLSQSEIRKVLEAFESVITKELADGGFVLLTGFGKFFVRSRAARNGINPRTFKPIEIPAHKLAAFVPGKKLKLALKN